MPLFNPVDLSGGLPVAAVTKKTRDANSVLPIILYATSIPVLTTGAPSDIASINVPIGISRWRVPGGTAGVPQLSLLVAETASGTLAGGSFAAYTGAGATGNAISSATSGPTAAGIAASWSPSAPTGILINTSSTIYIYQSGNSANAGSISFYITIYPIPSS